MRFFLNLVVSEENVLECFSIMKTHGKHGLSSLVRAIAHRHRFTVLPFSTLHIINSMSLCRTVPFGIMKIFLFCLFFMVLILKWCVFELSLVKFEEKGQLDRYPLILFEPKLWSLQFIRLNFFLIQLCFFVSCHQMKYSSTKIKTSFFNVRFNISVCGCVKNHTLFK